MNSTGREAQTKLRGLYRALEELRKFDADMPIQTAQTFLAVALKESISVKDVAEMIGTAQSSASRNIANLSDVNRFKKPGLDLVEGRLDPADFRKKNFSLTAKGRRVLESILNYLD